MSFEEKPTTQDPESGLFKNNSSSQSSFKKDLLPDNSSHVSESERADGEHGNILSQYTEKQVMVMGRNYALKYGLDPEIFAKGAALARAPNSYNSMPFLTDEEKQGLYLEQTKKWHLPKKLFAVIAAGAMAAAVQGMDESVINGATLFYPTAFRLKEKFPENYDLMEGLVNGAPYLFASVVGAWTTDFWNRHLGRKWTIFWTCAISAVTCVWSGFVNTYWHLIIARLFLGLGIGVKSATVPVYCSECTPARVRGSLVLMWQLWTAAGIMLGYVACLAFYYVPDKSFGTGLNWRLMLGSACIPAFIILFQIPFVPESPRWLMGKGRHKEAYESLSSLRFENVAAARDLFYQFVLLQEEEGNYDVPTWKRVIEMFTIRRNRNAAIGSWIVMFMQQFCGINVIAYYSSSIFIEAGISVINALVYAVSRQYLHSTAFTACGAFGFYAAWNLVGFFMVLWFLPETKQLTLEELDDVFAVPMYTHAIYRTRTFLRGFQEHVLRRKNLPEIPPIYTHQRMAVTNPSWNEKTEVDHIE
ncbi:uncharacterized protein KGF55_005573 [Candida pseudojiufengensis]|uniref:uncharacterized protein n=1 Tax=Candida pseudojiufengensis TaxID=497109 RepID=UPI0022258F5C|nr:uncharacterized protein KGF55_005573 [Candida pseudojiufengensis]KAI5959082.1 hypothetical protein KGF55_005573 [Candida pseudojiufengensis]